MRSKLQEENEQSTAAIGKRGNTQEKMLNHVRVTGNTTLISTFPYQTAKIYRSAPVLCGECTACWESVHQ